jgi:hypothetical protein
MTTTQQQNRRDLRQLRKILHLVQLVLSPYAAPDEKDQARQENDAIAEKLASDARD